jgi:hypothetical protein
MDEDPGAGGEPDEDDAAATAAAAAAGPAVTTAAAYRCGYRNVGGSTCGCDPDDAANNDAVKDPGGADARDVRKSLCWDRKPE